MSLTGGFEHLPLANGDVAPIRVRVDGRARRISLTIDKIDGVVTLTAPTEAALPAARRFLSTRTNWIAARRAEVKPRTPFAPGEAAPVLGRMRRLDHDAGAVDPARLEPDRLVVGGPASKFAAGVTNFLKVEARKRLTEAAHKHAAKLDVAVEAVTVRDPKTRWGSCASTGRLSFSWRLVMAPEHVLSYVAAHEVAHLRHMNHSAEFWDVVAELDPDYERAETWLKQEGMGLRRYG